MILGYVVNWGGYISGGSAASLVTRAYVSGESR